MWSSAGEFFLPSHCMVLHLFCLLGFNVRAAIAWFYMETSFFVDLPCQEGGTCYTRVEGRHRRIWYMFDSSPKMMKTYNGHLILKSVFQVTFHMNYTIYHTY